MAEGLIGGLLGGEEEKTEAEAPEALANAEAFAAAVAARLSAADPAVAKDTSEFLKEQTQLLRVQKEHLTDEHALRLANLRHQSHLLVGQRLGQAFRVGFQIFLAVVATVLGIGFFLMIHNAINARGVVIESFQVPQDLVQRGLSGQVIAKQILDQLSDMGVETSDRTARPADSYSSSWGNDLKVEVPETGVTFGELSRYLHETLGHEIHISGEVYDSSSGITITARSGEAAGKSFSGAAEDLNQLVRKAAESVYEQSQPYRFANYLLNHGRTQEGMVILRRLTHAVNPVDRAWAHMYLGASLFDAKDLAGYAAEEREALAALPGILRGTQFLAAAEALSGHDAAAVELARQCVSADPESRATIAPSWRGRVATECLALKSAAEGDYQAIVRAAAGLNAKDCSLIGSPGSVLPIGALYTHDWDAVWSDNWQCWLATAAGNPGAQEAFLNLRALELGRLALERREQQAVGLLAKVSADDDRLATPASHDYMLRVDAPWLALAKATFGDLQGGQELIGETP